MDFSDETYKKLIGALPDEGINELNTLLDNENINEKDILDLYEKYGVSVEGLLKDIANEAGE